ncbi:NAD-dependent epimerase/dehydratase family protein [Bacillus pumilus]|uniref:NAD-dependent epimerase/dehydratase family protein n=1 Tax=Bacillus pumilus TaxID=1408 RepID=UPI0011A9ED6E
MYEDEEKLIRRIIRKGMNGERMGIYGDGEEIGDWVYVEDDGRGVKEVLEKGRGGEV